MTAEVVYLNHDNEVDRILYAKGIPLTNDQMDAITKITITVNDTAYESTNQAGDVIRWRQVGYSEGMIHITLGGQSIPAGRCDATLVVYDPIYTNGVVWGPPFTMIVRDEVEGTVPP